MSLGVTLAIVVLIVVGLVLLAEVLDVCAKKRVQRRLDIRAAMRRQRRWR